MLFYRTRPIAPSPAPKIKKAKTLSFAPALNRTISLAKQNNCLLSYYHADRLTITTAHFPAAAALNNCTVILRPVAAVQTGSRCAARSATRLLPGAAGITRKINVENVLLLLLRCYV